MSLKHRYWLCHFVRSLPFGLVLPVFALLPVDRGLTVAEVGLVLGAFAASTAVLELPTGNLADVFGARGVLVAAGVLEAGSFCGFVLADTFEHFVAAAVLAGIGRALASGPLEAWYVNAVRAQEAQADVRPDVGVAMFLTNIAVLVGSVGAAGLGVVAPLGVGSFGHASALPFTAAAVASLLHVATIALLVHNRQESDAGSWSAGWSSLPRLALAAVRESLQAGPTRLLLLTGLSIGIGIGAVETFWQPHLATMIGSSRDATTTFGLVVAASTVVGAIGSLASARLPRVSLGATARLCTGVLALLGVAILALAAAPSLGTAIGAFLLVYLFLELRAPLSQSLLHHSVPPNLRASMLSAYSMSTSLGAVMAGAGLGQVAGAYGIPAAWLVGGAIVISASPAYLRLHRRLQ